MTGNFIQAAYVNTEDPAMKVLIITVETMEDGVITESYSLSEHEYCLN